MLTKIDRHRMGGKGKLKSKILCMYHRYKEIIDYIAMGVLTTIFGLILFYGSIGTFLNADDVLQLQAANIFSWSGSVVFAYTVNRTFVFKSHKTQILKELLSFAMSRVFTLLMDMAVMYAGTAMLDMNYHIVKFFSIMLVTIANYVISKFYIFRE